MCRLQATATKRGHIFRLSHGDLLFFATPPDTIVTPPTGNFIVEFSNQYSHTPSTTVNGTTATITQGSYWWFVRTGTAPFTFLLKKGTQIVKQTTDTSPIFDLNGNSNIYFQAGNTYTLTITDGSNQTRVINFTA